jgi:hypothetical protein
MDESGPRAEDRLEQAIWVGYGLLIGVCWVLGFRAFRVARRSRSPIDWALTIVVCFAGGFGCPLTFLPSLYPLEPAERAHVLAAGIGGLGFASIALYLALWRYFRPRSVVAALICSAGSFAIAWSLLAEVVTAGFAWGRDRRWLALGGIACWLPYAWGAIEMALESRRSRTGPPRDDSDASPRGYLLYSVALAAVTLVYPFGLVSAYRHPGGPHPKIVVAMVAAFGFTAASAAAIGFYWRSRRSRSGSGAPASSPHEARSSARSA